VGTDEELNDVAEEVVDLMDESGCDKQLKVSEVKMTPLVRSTIEFDFICSWAILKEYQPSCLCTMFCKNERP
jgi:hypothetical protein